MNERDKVFAALRDVYKATWDASWGANHSDEVEAGMEVLRQFILEHTPDPEQQREDEDDVPGGVPDAG